MEGIWLCLGFYPDMDKALVAKEQYPIETQTYRIVKVQLAS
jgi:hypothetical protein